MIWFVLSYLAKKCYLAAGAEFKANILPQLGGGTQGGIYAKWNIFCAYLAHIWRVFRISPPQTLPVLHIFRILLGSIWISSNHLSIWISSNHFSHCISGPFLVIPRPKFWSFWAILNHCWSISLWQISYYFGYLGHFPSQNHLICWIFVAQKVVKTGLKCLKWPKWLWPFMGWNGPKWLELTCQLGDLKMSKYRPGPEKSQSFRTFFCRFSGAF